MLTREQLIKLDPNLAYLSEDDFNKLREALYQTAQLSFEVWWLQKSGSKNPIGLFTLPISKATLPLWSPKR